MNGIFGTKDLSVIYNKGTPAESVALHNVTFDALPGEFVVVYGPSGCGKSTLLYTLTGIERHINEGEVWLNEKNVAAMSALELVALHRRDVGMIFQAYNLISTLNVLNNVTLPLLAAGISESKRREQAESLLDRFLIGHLAKRYPSQLSGGQQQRVAIARALVTDPGIIVADEPTGNLDSQSSEIVLQQLLELNGKYKKTILLVTHDSSFLAYADRILHMKDGTIIKTEVKEGLREMSAVSMSSAPEEDNQLGSSPFDKKLSDEELSFRDYSYIACISNYVPSIAKELDPILVVRLRNILIEVSLKILSRKDAIHALQNPVPLGGMGFSQDFTSEILVGLDELFDIRRILNGQPTTSRLSPTMLLHIMRWLLGVHFGTMTSLQSELMEKYLIEFFLQRLSREEFISKLDDSIEHDGVGLLGYNTAQLADKLLQIKDLIPTSSQWLV